jgi:general secretion pathway protein I
LRRRRARGFTLLEVLVATTIMAIAISSLLVALSGSLNNFSRLTDSDRAASLAKHTMDELIAAPSLAAGQMVEGRFQPETSGILGGWRARVEPLERLAQNSPLTPGVDRIVLEVWWMNGDRRRSFQLEGFRRAFVPGRLQW